MDKTKSDWVFVVKKNDIPVAGARVIEGAAAGSIAVFRSLDDVVFAVLDKCPHKGGPLSQGIVHGHAVTCPLHAWNINLADGCALAPDAGCARSYKTHCESGDVFLSATELASD
jgi:nitrite reductase (NADH) small subunit